MIPHWLRLLLMLVWLLPATKPFAQEPDLLDELDDAIFAANDSWWHDDWRFRRRLSIVDPAVKLRRSAYVRLAAPEPLFLYNLGRLREGGTDIRILGPDREPLEAGVIHFGQDDGTSYIWCRLPLGQDALFDADKQPRLFLYYGYQGNEPLPPLPQPPLLELTAPLAVELQPEETKPDSPPVDEPDPASFFDRLIVIEAEYLIDDNGHDGFNHRATPDVRSHALAANPSGASGGYYMASDYPWRAPAHTDYPHTWRGTVHLPEAGPWYLHVRYPVTQYVYYGATLDPKRIQAHFRPFNVSVGEQTFACGEDQSPGATFRYTRTRLDLPAGELPIAITLDAATGVDCLVFTRDPHYLPDIRDFSGPVYMRFAIAKAPVERFYVAPFCVIQPWSTHGPQGEYAGYLFRDLVAPTATDMEIARRTPDNYLIVDEWTPWIEMLTSTQITWWANIQVMPQGHGRALPDCTYRFEFATRPHPSRVFRSGTESTEAFPGLNILMPRRLDLATTLSQTRTFGQWAEDRYQRVQQLGLEVKKRPEKILITTMATAVSALETEYILRTCAALGFNGAEVRTPLADDTYWQLSDSLGLNWATTHHWYPKLDYPAWPAAPPEGTTAAETVRTLFAEGARATYSPEGPRWRHETPRLRLLIMGDEIGPATNPPLINQLPLIKGWFHEYLREQGLSPDFFGKTTWQEVDALWYKEVSPTSELGTLVNAIKLAQGEEIEDPAMAGAPSLPESELDAAFIPQADELVTAMMDAEGERQAAERTAHASTESSLHEKRLYHWSQKFRGLYTCELYAAGHREIRRLADQGSFHTMPYASPNFQALPIMRTQMWDGALNLFEWARHGTTDTLLIEDWIQHPYRVAYGFRTLQSAARKHDQQLGLLIVGGNMSQRYYAALANGARVFLSYLYGPLRVIGPPWADDEATMRMWSDVLSTTARCEDDIVATRPRPADAAILMAVTSDINHPYITHNPLGYPMGDRAALFAALQDSQIPVEILSEEELLEEPDALDRYKVLYVGDLHVDSRVQKTIRDWVRKGGTIWGNHAAMARQEYDQPADLMNDIFGLRQPRHIEDLKRVDDPEAGEMIQVAAGLEGLSPVRFRSGPIKPNWQLTDGVELLATFDDGAPAFIRHRAGKGYAWLFGGPVHPLTSGYGRDSAEPPDAAAIRRLVAVAAEQAGARRHLTLSRSRVMTFVNDGPDQTVLFLINCHEAATNDLSVSLELPRRPATAYNGSGDPLEWEWENGRASFRIDLPHRDGRILVFRY